MATEANAVTAEVNAAAVVTTEVNAAVDPATALYVGDLDGGVTEDQLKLLFDQIGEVSSVRICEDQITKQSLGYGFVNYVNPRHAAKALELLNFTPLNGRPIRIAYSNRDGTLRKSGLGNIFVKNLDKSIHHRTLYHIFSTYGNIISCKVETDYCGISKGYGYVHYEDDECARNAVERLNGVMFYGSKLFVGPFVSRRDRELAIDKTRFTNVFVKNMSGSTSEEDLRSIFNEFGPITSAAVMRNEAGNSKCFGFVNFENAEDAAKSVEVLNGRVFDGKEWYVGRAQKRSEREEELKRRRERSLEMNNVYIKHIDEEIGSDELKELFSPFGIIQSCKVMLDPRGISRGYGFVAFSTAQEASKAISEMNGKMVGSKPLYVGIAERKEDRQRRLQSFFANVRPTTLSPLLSPPVSPRMPVYSPGGSGIGQQMLFGHGGPIYPPLSRFGNQHQLLPGMRPPGVLMPTILFPPVQRGPPGLAGSGNNVQQRSQQIVPLMHQQQSPFRRHAHHRPPQRPGSMLSLPSEVAGPRARIRRFVPVGTMASGLANASPTEQRTMLGENLYPLVEQIERGMAAKVTGVLLEMDQTEILHLLESPESLRTKVMEAMEVLRNAPGPSEEITTVSLNE